MRHDRKGRATTFEYDAMGRLTKTTHPDGLFESSTFDAEGRRLTSRDRGGRTMTSEYDRVGRLTKTTMPGGASTRSVYDVLGRLTQSFDEAGNGTRYEYDGAGQRTVTVDALGHRTEFGYDDWGNQTSMRDALDRTWTFVYDETRRRTRTVYPDTTSDETDYDDAGRVVSRRDQAGKQTVYAYNLLGQLVSVTDARGKITRYGYDEVGSQLTQTDALGRVTRYDYDQMGRRTRRQLPGGQVETMTYDASGNVATRTDFAGRTTGYGYDTLDRLVRRTPDARTGEAEVRWSYTTTSRRATMTDATGVTVYGYDDRDRLTEKQTPWGTLTYGYGTDGNLSSIRSSNAGGVWTEYGYDELNRLETVTDERMGGAATSYRYDEVGNLAGSTYTNGVRTDYVYNALNRLESVTMKDAGAATLASFGYSLGAAGNRTGVTEASSRTVTYGYDDLYRLTSETIATDPNGANGEIGYVYDDVGNRLARTSTHPALANQTASYDANDRVATEQYDANGNTIGASGQGYGWDAENRLTVLNAGTAGEVRYAYDGDGNRVAKTANGVTTRYLVDTMNPTGYAQTVEELTESAGQAATVTRRYTYGLDLISQEQPIGGVWTASWYGYDGHGNVRSLTDAAGAVTDRYDYDAYGTLIASAGTTPNEYLYTGERFDPALGFYYLRARYLVPAQGRFVGMDSYGGLRTDPASLHKYQYAANQPIDFLDPSGHMTLAQQVQVGAIIGIVVSLAAFIGFTSLANYYLPSDAFTTMPDASVIGFQVSYPIGRAIRRVHDSPLSLGLSIGLLLTAGIGGLDLVMPLGKPNTAWAYAYAGLSVGFGQVLRGRSMSGYVGFVWNVKSASDYAGPFFSTTVTPGSAVSSLLGARFHGRSVTVSSSPPKADGSPGAYAATIGIESAHQKTAQASGTYFNYLGDVGASMHPHDSTSDGGSIDLLVGRWYSLAEELYPE